MFRYPVYQPSIGDVEKKYVNECLDTGWISGKGRFVSEFEDTFAEYVGVRHAATVCNGTVALHLALVALGIGPGDEVVVPTFTYIAPVNAIVYTGAKPVFVDSLPETWQMDPEKVRAKISPATKAIIAVHLYGHPCDLARLRDIADKAGIFLIEDCAEAIGSRYDDRHVGHTADIATFSFYGNKTITTGEGGMVVTNDQTLYDRTIHLRGQGLAKYREYWHDVVGFNFRMTNICAAIGLGQIQRIDEIVQQKRKLAGWYRDRIDGCGIEFHSEVGRVFHSYWMISVLLADSRQRDLVRKHLSDKGIETRPTFYPVHTMPMYSARYERHPVAEDIGWRGINLPSYPELTEEDVAYITFELRAALGNLV